MPKNVLISAFIGSENLGDEAIFESILANTDFGTARVSALSVNPSQTQKKGVTAIYAKNPIAVYGAIRQADIVVMGGGGIIQDQSSILNIFYYCFQLFVAKIHKTPVILAFVGVGPLRYGISRWVLSKSSGSIKLAIVRDSKSKKMLKDVCRRLDVLEYYDPVINYPAVAASVDDRQRGQEDIILISLRQWFFSIPMLPASTARRLNAAGIKSKRYKKLVANLASTFDKYLENNASSILQFESFYDSEDLQMTSDVLAAMEYRHRCRRPKTQLSTAEYISLVAKAQFLVGIRLHSLIMASIVGKPFVAINYSPKVKSFAEMMHQADVMYNINDRDAKKLFDSMNAVASSVDTRSNIVKMQWELMKQRNQEAFRLISDEITKA